MDWLLEERGEVDVKGKGVMRTWFLLAQRDMQGEISDAERGLRVG